MVVKSVQSKAIILARVSSRSQEEGYSLDAQLKLLRAYCSGNGLAVAREFRITETASKQQSRTIFHDMVRYIKKEKIEHLAVEKTDRLTRNFHDAVVVDDWLEADQRRKLHMVKEGLLIHKNSRSDTKLMWNIYLSFAKKYTDNLREEAMKGWREKLEQGWMPASSPPGYKTAVENGKKIHVIDEDRAFLVERAYRLYLEPGQNINTVTEEVSRSGFVSRNGRPLSKSAIHKMLHNPFYVGTIRFDGQEYPGAHEPLLSKELFYAVQAKLATGYNERVVEHDPLFKGMLRCDDCGATVTWQLQKGRYYGACQRRNEACKGRRMLREDWLEEQLLIEIDALDMRSSGKAQLQRLVGLLASRRTPYIGQHRESVIKMIQQQIRRLERIEDNLYDDKLAGTLDEQKYSQKTKTIQDELSTLRQRLDRLAEVEVKTRRPKEPSTLRELYMGESKTGKRQITQELFSLRFSEGHVEIKPVEN